MTKIYIGLLFGSIAACFVLIGLLHEAQNSQLVPRLTVSSVFMACFLNLFVLLAYVQHVARLSIADNIISKIHVSIKNSIERIKEQDKAQASGAKKNSWPKDFEQKSRCMYASQSGYIQIIDYETLKDLAEDHKFQIQLHVSAGDFIIQGAEVASLTPKSRGSGDLEKEIEATIVYGQTRTGSQDIEYSVRHLVEIGLRALSPGINDHYTAIAVLNKLSDSLARLFKKELPERIYCDAKGKILLKGRKDSKRDIVFEALSSIRNAGQTKPDILAHLIINLKRLKKMAERAEEKNAIEQQLVYIKDHISHNFGESEEGKYLLKIYG